MVYFDNVSLTSQKPCQYNNKFDCSETNVYTIPQDALNEFYAFTSEQPKIFKMWSCENVCDALHYLWAISVQDLTQNYIDKL